MRLRSFPTGVLLVALIAVAVVLLTRSSGEPQSSEVWLTPASTYSTGRTGAKALYLLFQSLGLSTRRMRSLEYKSLEPGSALWRLSRKHLTPSERHQLVAFLRRGGAVILAAAPAVELLSAADLGSPEVVEATKSVKSSWDLTVELSENATAIQGAPSPDETYASSTEGWPVVAAWKVGGGKLVTIGFDELARNSQIGLAQNGPFLFRLAQAVGRTHIFDEFALGFGETSLLSLFERLPYRWALAQLCLTALVAILAAGIRTLPAEVVGPLRRRSTRDHVDAVASLWWHSRDGGLPLEAMLRAANERARVRLGRTSAEAPFVEWVRHNKPYLAKEAEDAWRNAAVLASESPRPSLHESREAASSIRRIEKEALRW